MTDDDRPDDKRSHDPPEVYDRADLDDMRRSEIRHRHAAEVKRLEEDRSLATRETLRRVRASQAAALRKLGADLVDTSRPYWVAEDGEQVLINRRRVWLDQLEGSDRGGFGAKVSGRVASSNPPGRRRGYQPVDRDEVRQGPPRHLGDADTEREAGDAGQCRGSLRPLRRHRPRGPSRRRPLEGVRRRGDRAGPHGLTVDGLAGYSHRLGSLAFSGYDRDRPDPTNPATDDFAAWRCLAGPDGGVRP